MNQLLMEFKEMDSSILKLMKSGIKFSFMFNIWASLILLAYDFGYTYPILYSTGISLFKTSLFFMVGFVICGFAFNKFYKELNK